MSKNLQSRKQHMVELMMKVHGVEYTMGWLEHAWLFPAPDDVVEKVVDKTILKLETELENKNV